MDYQHCGKLVYVAGSFRGKTPWEVESNIRKAEAVGLEIAKKGGVPVIPHTMYRFFDKVLSDQFWLDATLSVMHKCDGLVLCVGWENSEGSRNERAEAERAGIKVWEERQIEEKDFSCWLRDDFRSSLMCVWSQRSVAK